MKTSQGNLYAHGAGGGGGGGGQGSKSAKPFGADFFPLYWVFWARPRLGKKGGVGPVYRGTYSGVGILTLGGRTPHPRGGAAYLGPNNHEKKWGRAPETGRGGPAAGGGSCLPPSSLFPGLGSGLGQAKGTGLVIHFFANPDSFGKKPRAGVEEARGLHLKILWGGRWPPTPRAKANTGLISREAPPSPIAATSGHKFSPPNHGGGGQTFCLARPNQAANHHSRGGVGGWGGGGRISGAIFFPGPGASYDFRRKNGAVFFFRSGAPAWGGWDRGSPNCRRFRPGKG